MSKVFQEEFLKGYKPGDPNAVLEKVVKREDRQPTKSDIAHGWIKGVAEGIGNVVKGIGELVENIQIKDTSVEGEKGGGLEGMPDWVSPTGNVRRSANDIMVDPKYVTIDKGKLNDVLKGRREEDVKPEWDVGGVHYVSEDREKTALYVLVLDCMNFCFWPSKNSAMQYNHVAIALKNIAENEVEGFRFTPGKLRDVDATFFDEEVDPLLPEGVNMPDKEERVGLLRELGSTLIYRHKGSALNMIRSASKSAER